MKRELLANILRKWIIYTW